MWFGSNRANIEIHMGIKMANVKKRAAFCCAALVAMWLLLFCVGAAHGQTPPRNPRRRI